MILLKKPIIILLIIVLLIIVLSECKLNNFNNNNIKKIHWKEKKIENKLNTFYYPQVYHQNKSIEKRINTTINKLLNEMKVVEYEKVTQTALGNYKITYNNNSLLSIMFIYRYRIEGSLSYMDYIASLTFDIESGETLSLKDLFNDNYNYLSILNSYLKKYFNDMDIDETFTGIEDEYLFYLTKDGLSIYFPPSHYTSSNLNPLVVNINSNKFDKNFILNK